MNSIEYENFIDLSPTQTAFEIDCDLFKTNDIQFYLNFQSCFSDIADSWQLRWSDPRELEKLIQHLLISEKRGKFQFLSEAWKISRNWTCTHTQTSFLTTFLLTQKNLNYSYIFVIQIFRRQSEYSGTLSLYLLTLESGSPTIQKKLSSHSWVPSINRLLLREGLPSNWFPRGLKLLKQFESTSSNDLLTKILSLF